MFNKEFNYFNKHSSVDANIRVNEHRAPTDESVKLLNEMERKAQDNLVMKISDNRPNALHLEIFIFQKYATMDLLPKGTMALRVNINGKKYERSVALTSSYMHWVLGNRRINELHQIDINEPIRRYIFFQAMFLITSAILDDKKNLDFFIEKIQTDGPIDFDLGKIQEELEYNC